MNVDELRDKVLQLNIGAVSLPAIDFMPYQPGLREKVSIHALFDNTLDDPAGSDAALIRYEAGAFTPRHLHMGYEMVFVLSGDYIENDVSFGPGALIIRAPGTTHEMRSRGGCTFLAMRDVPVKQLT
jgi:hypothetical protein